MASGTLLKSSAIVQSNVKPVDASASIVECLRCGHRWRQNVKPHSGGRFYRWSEAPSLSYHQRPLGPGDGLGTMNEAYLARVVPNRYVASATDARIGTGCSDLLRSGRGFTESTFTFPTMSWVRETARNALAGQEFGRKIGFADNAALIFGLYLNNGSHAALTKRVGASSH